MASDLEMYINACIAYYYKDNSIMDDWQYDELANRLYMNYHTLPMWFQELVPEREFEGGGYVVGFKFGTGEWRIPNDGT